MSDSPHCVLKTLEEPCFLFLLSLILNVIIVMLFVSIIKLTLFSDLFPVKGKQPHYLIKGQRSMKRHTGYRCNVNNIPFVVCHTLCSTGQKYLCWSRGCIYVAYVVLCIQHMTNEVLWMCTCPKIDMLNTINAIKT